MKISYNWLKWYIPDCSPAEKMWDIFTYHLCEVESIEKLPNGDTIFDINILPNRAHDLLSHQGIARELASLLNIPFTDPTPKYKIPQSKPTQLKIEVQSDKCRRYMGRIVRNVKVGESPEWVKNHLESIGQRSINNIVDAANIVMYDSGQPIHCFDLDKVKTKLVIREAKEGEKATTLDNKEVKLKPTHLVIADSENVLAIAGIKGGKIAEVDENTKNIIIEVANFDPVSVRKTRREINIFTDAAKRFENDLSPELCDFAMLEISGLIAEYGFTDFEDVVDIYPQKQEERKLAFSLSKISKILGREVTPEEVEDILKRYNFEFTKEGDMYEIKVPLLRLDLKIEEDMAEEFGRIAGYHKVMPNIPKIDFKPKVNDVYTMIEKCRGYLLSQGYHELMTYTFRDKGNIEVLESASDKKFLRTNLKDGLMESMRLNDINESFLGIKPMRMFEIGTVWDPEEKIKVCWFEGKMNKPEEKDLKDYYQSIPSDFVLEPRIYNLATNFKTWSLYPFVARDIALWVPEGVSSEDVSKVIRENMGEMVVKGPVLFDEFKKEGKVSYAFRMVFQSYIKTLTDGEVNDVMLKINEKLSQNKDWQMR